VLLPVDLEHFDTSLGIISLFSPPNKIGSSVALGSTIHTTSILNRSEDKLKISFSPFYEEFVIEVALFVALLLKMPRLVFSSLMTFFINAVCNVI